MAIVQFIAFRQMAQHPVAPAFSQHRFIRHGQRQHHQLAALLGIREFRRRQIAQIGAGKAAIRDVIRGHKLCNRLFHNRQQAGKEGENQRLLVGEMVQ